MPLLSTDISLSVEFLFPWDTEAVNLSLVRTTGLKEMPQWVGKAILHSKATRSSGPVTQGVLVILPSCLLGFLNACIFLP